MRTPNIEQWTVDQVVEKIAGAENVLRPQGISVTNRLSLANAAAATTIETDELLAMMDYRLRRAAQKVRVEEHAHAEEEVVA